MTRILKTKALIGLVLLIQGPWVSSQSKDHSVLFEKQVVLGTFVSEGVAVADVNKDGRKDILAGTYWFEAPHWKPHEISPPENPDYATGYSNSFLNFSMDVDLDGWMDFIRFGLPGEAVYWYKNPQGKEGHWKAYLIDKNACNESPMLVDVDNNGRLDLVFANEDTQTMVWFRPPRNAENPIWEALPISQGNAPGTQRYSHGLGFGDVNGDGRNDIMTKHGWWQAPSDRKNIPWAFHSTSLGDDCSQMYTFDLDADGDYDVLSASAHNYGIWWHEQEEGETGPIFHKHEIDNTFSQSHGAAFSDINADGLPDFITGKRFYAHLGKDPGGLDPAVLYWYELQRDAQQKPYWTPHLIDDDSGVGLQVVIEDMDSDGKPDIVTANKKGVFCFFQR